MQHVIVHNLFTYCSCAAVARRNFCYVNVHNSLHFVAFSLSQAGNGDCGNKTTTKATNATKKIKRKITETKKTSFFHQKARWSCLSLSHFPWQNQSNVRLRRTWQQAARQHQQGATPTRRVKTKRNETTRGDAIRCDAMRCKRKTRRHQQLPTTTFVTWSILAAGLGPRLRLRLPTTPTLLGNICRGEKHVFGNGIDHVWHRLHRQPKLPTAKLFQLFPHAAFVWRYCRGEGEALLANI